jgi:hypothetical protein
MLTSIRTTEHGLEAHFRREADADVRRFAAAEKQCCRFWGFDVTTAADVRLRWDGPPAARAYLDQIEAYFSGDASLDALIAPS